MSITGWALVMGAVGTAGFFARRSWIKKQHESKKDQAKRKTRAEQAELDRIACRDLGKSLMASSPGSSQDEVPVPSDSRGVKSSG